MPYFRVVEQVSRDQLSNVPGADDHSVLEVARLSPAVEAAARARQRDRDHSDRPEREDLAERRLRDRQHIDERDQQPADQRHELENA